jgi:hypothetical protein
MMVHRDKRGGSLIIDRVFKGVGRIKRASGTTNPAVRRKLDAMLTRLADDGNVELLRAIRDGKLSLLEVYDAFRRRALEQLPTGGTARPLAASMRAWLEGFTCSAKHRESIEYSIRYIERHAPKALVADIARVVDELRITIGREHPRTWNLLRSHAQTYVRETLKRSHPLWLEVAACEPLEVKSTRRPRTLTPRELRDRFPAPDTDPVDAIAWGMATTGMLQHEYWGRWEVRRDRVHIAGTKREGRVRDVPLVWRPAVPQLHRRTFENKLRERCPDMEARDLRNTFATWMEDAAVPRTRRRMYLGHGKKDVTDLYERREVDAFLAEDAEKLRQFLALSHEKSHGLEVAK